MKWLEKWYANKGQMVTVHNMDELNDLLASEKKIYDVIVLEDIIFPNDPQQVIRILEALQQVMTDDGNILIATYNRLGLRFFNGAPEPFTGEYFLGISNYNASNTYNTFGRQEWVDVLEGTHYSYRFYYPYPEHHYPEEIFSDMSINQYGYGRPYPNLVGRRYELYNEQKVAQAFSDARIMQEFAHAFLIELNAKKEYIEYTKFSTDRKKQYSIKTCIISDGNEKWVEKSATDDSANSHIYHMWQNTKQTNLHLLSAKLKGENTVCYDFLQGENYESVMLKALNKRDTERLFMLLHEYYTLLTENAQVMSYRSELFTKIFGEKQSEPEVLCVQPANIDLIFDNIYFLDDTHKMTNIRVIDGEWIFDCAVPVDLIFWRALNEFYGKHPMMEGVIPFKMICEKYGLDEAKCNKFQQWNQYFTLDYVGAGQANQNQKKTDLLSLNEIRWKQQPGRRILVTAYWKINKEDEFCEENAVYREAEDQGDYHYAITFYKQELKGRAEVRLDVQKGTFCKCRIISTKGIKGIFPQNVYKREGEFAYFLSTDSSYMIEMDEDADEIYVEYELIDCEHETRNYLINQLQTVTNENQRVREECDRLRNELSMHNQMEQEDREWQKKLSESKSSRGYQGIQKLKKLGKK